MRKKRTIITLIINALKEKYPNGSGFPVYPIEKEHQLLAQIQKKNLEEAEELLAELISVIIFCNQENFTHIQQRSIDLVELASDKINSCGEQINNNCYIKLIQEAKTVGELITILQIIVECIFNAREKKLKKAVTFIKENLTRKISLREVAKIAGIPEPYFNIIFKEVMGENLSKYIDRQRVEKASEMLLETDISLSEISKACCFKDQSWFTKIFKDFTGINPGEYRRQGKCNALLSNHRENMGP